MDYILFVSTYQRDLSSFSANFMHAQNSAMQFFFALDDHVIFHLCLRSPHKVYPGIFQRSINLYTFFSILGKFYGQIRKNLPDYYKPRVKVDSFLLVLKWVNWRRVRLLIRKGPLIRAWFLRIYLRPTRRIRPGPDPCTTRVRAGPVLRPKIQYPGRLF